MTITNARRMSCRNAQKVKALLGSLVALARTPTADEPMIGPTRATVYDRRTNDASSDSFQTNQFLLEGQLFRAMNTFVLIRIFQEINQIIS
jgi:hypothetical protein